MGPSHDLPVDALLAASRNGDAEAVAGIWRTLTPVEQETVLLRLLGMQTATGLDEPGQASEQTEVIPKGVEELRTLTVAEGDDTAAAAEPAHPTERSPYWARWRRRWPLSAVIAAWAMTTVFAFTADTSAFGPTEWAVALFGTVVLGGALVGTLLNCAVAAIPPRAEQA